MKIHNRVPRTYAATALAALLFSVLPAAAFAALPAYGSDIPLAQGEAPARSCYLHAESLWNQTIAHAARDRAQLDTSYRTFAACAKVAIDTGRMLRSGKRLPWMPEYFADTVGATYAQLQLATITPNPEHCSHLSQAKDLADQAMQTESDMATPGNADFETMWQTLQQNVSAQAAQCGKSSNG